jgi:epoxyqueuosine reductase
MAYLERTAQARVDPQRVLPGARSVIVVAVSYAEPITAHPLPALSPQHTGASAQAAHIASSCGVVARYARFVDYHRLLGPRLQALADFVDRLGPAGTRSVAYVDTGPVLERDLAQRAGIGFVGKHTNLISRRWGNWLLLGEILTTLELEPDEPEPNRCGTCTRCLAACPTGALVDAFVLDARRCIAYLTIELKHSIPEPLRPAVGARIFGCDACLEVCPWNRFARPGRLLPEHARPDLSALDLLGLLELDEVGFRRRFSSTPLIRAKRAGLLRNACVALGNLSKPTALPALTRAAADAEPLVAEAARWALQQLECREYGRRGC